MARVAIYTRVSDPTQHTENQLPALLAWVQSRGHEFVAEYTENESAWKAGHQQELARLLDDIRSGRRKFDILLVWALDRLTRQGAAAVLNMVNTFKTYGVRVVSIQELWTELPGELGEVLFAIAGWAARMESQRRSERTKAGLRRACANGAKLGRPKGSRDQKPRRKSGYLNRWSKQTSGGSQSQIATPVGRSE